MIRDIAPFEKFFIKGRCFIQLGVKCKTQKIASSVVERLSKNVLGLHSRCEDMKIICEKQDVPVYKLPNNFKSMREACLYMAEKHTRPVNQALGSIGANNDTVVLNVNHACGDGGYLLFLYDYLKNNKDYILPKTFEPVEKTFAKEMASNNTCPKFVTVDPTLTRIKPRDPLHLNDAAMAQHFVYKSKAEDLKFYNKKEGKLHGLTDNLWSMLILATSAYNGKFDFKSCATCYNLRPYVKNINFGNTNTFSSVNVCADADRDTTIGELNHRLRANFNKNIKEGTQFGYLNGVAKGTESGASMPGIGIELSNVGQLKLGGPFTDAWMALTMRSYASPGIISYMTFAIENPEVGRNDIYTQMRYPPQGLSKREAELIVRSVHYGIENFDSSMKCGEAIDKLTDVQRRIWKEYSENQLKFFYPK